MRSKWKNTIGVTAAVALVIAGGAGLASADNIYNTVDATIDATAEIMPLNVGGPNGTTTLAVDPANSDGKNGCNLTGSTTLGVSISSDTPGVATVSPATATFTSCGDIKTLTVSPQAVGTATITVSQTSNNTGATFDFAPATFVVNVAGPANTAPTVTVAGVSEGGSYAKGSVPDATCNVVDAEDGNSSFPATLSVITGPDAIDGIGSQTASCSYTDTGGLTASGSVTYSIIDSTAPDISYVLNPTSPDGTNNWYTSDVTLTWTVSEPDSPNSLVETGCDDQSITADQQATTYSCSATSAGGSAGPVEVSIKRDATAPTISHLISGTAGDNGWYTSDVTVQFTCGDDTSGIATCTSDTPLGEGADQVVNGSATDNAGNSASDPVSVNVDETAPTVTVTGPANGGTYTLGSVPAAGCSTVDGLSGVATYATLSSSGGPVGSVTATCTGGKDVAGNTAAPVSVTYSVNYNWTGFFQPVNNMPTLNISKAGSSIPVKFSLSGNQGLNIFAAGSPGSAPITCDSTDPTDPIESTVTAGSSSLSYDPTADQYIYVWKTDKSWAGTCRQLTVTLVDGTKHRANFKFTK